MSHCRPLHAVLTALVLLLYVASPASAVPWNKLQSSHFLIVGEIAPARLTAIAKTLEDFRQATDRVFGDLAVEAPRPLTIVVVNPVTMLDYAPGGSNGVAAFYRRTADRDYIVMGSNTFGGSDFETVLHEYQHLITHANFPVTPGWVDEGLAEFYSTFEADGNNRYKIGIPVERHLETLNQLGTYPLLQFLEEDGRSMGFDDRIRVGIYYAESWALIHFFMLGDGGKWSKTFGPFVDALVAGEKVDTAFRRTVSADVKEFESRFKAYLVSRRFNYLTFNARSQTGDATAVRTAKLSEAETETLKATLSNDSKKAAAAVILALKADPTYRPALVLKAAHLLVERQSAQAADELSALALADSSEVPTCSLALFASNLAGRFAESLKICPDVRGSVAVAFERAVALDGLGERAEATRVFDSVERAPAEALGDIRGREWRHLEAGRYTAAARAAELMTRVTQGPDAIAYLSLVRTVSMCLQDACAEARKALKTSPVPAGASPWVQQLLRYHTDGLDESILLKGATTKDQETEAHSYVAFDLLAQHKTAEAVAHLKWVAERGSRNVTEYYVAVAHLARLAKP